MEGRGGLIVLQKSSEQANYAVAGVMCASGSRPEPEKTQLLSLLFFSSSVFCSEGSGSGPALLR